jgi:hypothetical protein
LHFSVLGNLHLCVAKGISDLEKAIRALLR